MAVAQEMLWGTDTTTRRESDGMRRLLILIAPAPLSVLARADGMTT